MTQLTTKLHKRRFLHGKVFKLEFVPIEMILEELDIEI